MEGADARGPHRAAEDHPVRRERGQLAAVNQVLFRYTGEDTQAVVAPLYHNSALGMSVGGLLFGQHLVVMKRFDAEEALRLIAEHGITWLMLVPTMMHRMYRVTKVGGTDPAS